jgi:hypothetical protein
VKIEINEKEEGVLPGGGYINFELLFMGTKNFAAAFGIRREDEKGN